MNRYERRRVTAASIFTVVALLVLWAFNRPSSASSSAVTTSPNATPPSTTAYESPTPLFVGGDDVPTPPGVVNIAVPPAPGANERLTQASFHRYVGYVGPVCTSLLAPDGATVKVSNVDNGLSITCTNTLGMAVPAGTGIVIDTALFVQIGDLADAPIPVRMSW